MQLQMAKCVMMLVMGGVLALPCTSLDRRLLFVGVPGSRGLVECGALGSPPGDFSCELMRSPLFHYRRHTSPRLQTTMLSLGNDARVGGKGKWFDPAGGGKEELDLLKYALDRMDQKGVRCQQLRPQEQEQMHRYARAVAKRADGDAEGTGYLNSANAAWALAGRWRLVLAPQEWSWLLGLLKGADVLVDVNTEKATIDYAIHFPNRWQLLQRLQWHARFSLGAGARDVAGGASVQMMSFEIIRLLAVIAGLFECFHTHFHIYIHTRKNLSV